MQILHLTADFPDPLGPGKTRAIANLLELVPEHRHLVYSLKRVDWRLGIHALRFGADHRAVAYGAPPRGLWHQRYLLELSDRIGRDLERRRLRPDAIHAHKLSVEALAAAPLAEKLGVPLVISCQGNSDLKIIQNKPSLRPVWRRLWQQAEVVLPFAPWTSEALTSLLGRRSGPMITLPCPTPADRIIAPVQAGPVVRSVFNLDEHRNKNSALLIRAIAQAARTIPEITLEITGAGSATSFAELSAFAARYRAPVRLLGPAPPARIQALINRSGCLVVPSRRETYGMVFAEALLAGCPVIHGAGNAITGYFPGAPFAREAAGDPPGLAVQIIDMLCTEGAIKRALAETQRTGRLVQLTRPAIAARYRRALALATGSTTPDQGTAAVAELVRAA